MAKRERNKKSSFKEQISEMLDVPPEVVSDLPRIVLHGNQAIHVENFMGLIEYNLQKIRINTKSGILVIDGIQLVAERMTADQISIKGTILQISFLQ